MAPFLNPFVPGAGTQPPELTGREVGDTAFTLPLFNVLLKRAMPEWPASVPDTDA
jgi:hypothetical protein